MSKAERKTKQIQIYAYQGYSTESSCFPIDELNDKIVELKKLCENYTDCYAEIQGGDDGEWVLTVYGNELESQEEADAREQREAMHKAKADKFKQQMIDQSIKLLEKEGYSVEKEKKECKGEKNE